MAHDYQQEAVILSPASDHVAGDTQAMKTALRRREIDEDSLNQ
jgi:hypothetical protein